MAKRNGFGNLDQTKKLIRLAASDTRKAGGQQVCHSNGVSARLTLLVALNETPVSSFLAFLLALPTAAQSPKRSSSPSRPQQQLCSLSGMVVKLAGSEPLRSATVELQSLEDRTHTVSVATDAGGRFQIKGIDPGRYRLKVIRNGFVTQEYGQKTPSDPGSDLRLSTGQNLKDLLFRLIPWSVIAGRILNEDGEPLPWAQVSALREVYREGKRKLSPELMVPTNDLGEYRLFGLQPGRYFVSAKYKPVSKSSDNNKSKRASATILNAATHQRITLEALIRPELLPLPSKPATRSLLLKFSCGLSRYLGSAAASTIWFRPSVPAPGSTLYCSLAIPAWPGASPTNRFTSRSPTAPLKSPMCCQALTCFPRSGLMRAKDIRHGRALKSGMQMWKV